MTLNEFKKYLRQQIESFDDSTDAAVDRNDETVEVIRDAQRYAVELGLPRVAEVCAKVTTPLLALPTARIVLCECLSLVETPRYTDGMLSLREAAELLGYTESGLRKIIARKGIEFFQSRPWAPIKFRREWVDSFIMGHSTMLPHPPIVRSRNSHGANWDCQ
jgi:hypothetical protein